MYKLTVALHSLAYHLAVLQLVLGQHFGDGDERL